jgi:hypothetical protein
MTFSERDHHQCQVDAIAEALQELMANQDTSLMAKQGLAEAINSWYDYHYKELEKWSSLKRLLEHPL